MIASFFSHKETQKAQKLNCGLLPSHKARLSQFVCASSSSSRAFGDKGIPSHVEINPPEGGVKLRSFIKCEEVRSISTDRLVKALGSVKTPTLHQVEQRLRLLLNL
jgi:mRNA-degrading endonuclease toxin of MazEF toxin-antitoxin module